MLTGYFTHALTHGSRGRWKHVQSRDQTTRRHLPLPLPHGASGPSALPSPIPAISAVLADAQDPTESSISQMKINAPINSTLQ